MHSSSMRHTHHDTRTASSPEPAGFTLPELLGVLAIALLLAAMAGSSLTTVPARRAALLQLRCAIESARSEAIHGGREVFVAFTDSLEGASFEHANAYRFNRYALFARDPAATEAGWHPAPDPLTCPLTDLRGWTPLPEGILFALGEDLPERTDHDGSRLRTIIDGSDPATACSAVREFPFAIEGPGATRKFPFLMFDPGGAVAYPQGFESSFLHLAVVAGKVTDTGEPRRILTSTALQPDKPGQSSPAEILVVHRHTGRCRIVSPNP